MKKKAIVALLAACTLLLAACGQTGGGAEQPAPAASAKSSPGEEITGADKADTVRAMLRGPVTPRLPASVLAFHRDVVVMLDAAAAGKLEA